MARLPSQILVPLFIVLLLAGAILTGGRKHQDKSGRPTIVYAHPPCPPDLMVCFERAFDDFRATHPGIDLRVLHITGNYEDKVKIMFAGKVAPDVIFMYATALSAWVALDALAPLSDRIERDTDSAAEDYFQAGLDTFSLGGQLYGLPKDASAEIVFYNKDMFREQGIAFPTRDWTWDDFRDAARALTRDTDEDGRTDVYGAIQPTWSTMVLQNGGKVISDDGTRCLLDQPAAVDALTRWAELRTLHQVVPTPEATMDTSTWRLFAVKRLGMLVSMYPGVPILRRTCDFDWDIALLPRGTVNRYSAFTGSALAVTSQSVNKDAAFTFARWMTSEGMRHVMTFDIPAYKPLGESDEWREASLPPASKAVAIEAMAHAGEPAVKHPDWNEINDAINPSLDRVNRSMITVLEAVKEIVPKVNAILQRRKSAGTVRECGEP